MQRVVFYSPYFLYLLTILVKLSIKFVQLLSRMTLYDVNQLIGSLHGGEKKDGF